MVNDIAAGFVNRQLDSIYCGLIEAGCLGRLGDELADLLQAVEPARECLRAHHFQLAAA
jgi:hypothetical protein